MQTAEQLNPGTGNALSLSQTLQRAVRLHRDATAIVDGERHITWAEFGARVTRLAGALQALGMAPGDRVAMLANNSHRHLDFYHGTAWGGGIFTPLNFRLAAPELVAILDDADARIVIVDQANLALGREVLARFAARHVVYAGDGPTPEGMLNFDALMEGKASIPSAWPMPFRLYGSQPRGMIDIGNQHFVRAHADVDISELNP